MEKIKNLLPVFLAVAVLWLFVDRYALQTTSQPGETTENTVITNDTLRSNIRIAYVNIDSLLLLYEKSIEFNKAFGAKRQKSEAEFAQKARTLEKEFMEFQEKAQRGGFLSQTSMQAQQETLLRKRDELEKLENQLTNELMTEQQRLNEELFSAIIDFVNEYNKTAGYNLILTNTGHGTVLYGSPAINITREIVDGLNQQYREKK